MKVDNVNYLGRYGEKNIAQHFLNDGDYILSPFNEGPIKVVSDKICSFHQDSQIIISDETLVGNPLISGLNSKAVAQRLFSTLMEAKIFIVIREQCSMILSLYFQYLRAGGTLKLTSFLRNKYNVTSALFSPSVFCYSDLIDYYQKLFPGRVLVLPYEMIDANNYQFLKELSQFANLHINPDIIQNNKRHNVTSNHGFEASIRPLNYLTRSKFHKPMINIPGIRSVKVNLSHSFSFLKFNKYKTDSLKLIDGQFGDLFRLDNDKLSDLVNFSLKKYKYKL